MILIPPSGRLPLDPGWKKIPLKIDRFFLFYFQFIRSPSQPSVTRPLVLILIRSAVFQDKQIDVEKELRSPPYHPILFRDRYRDVHFSPLEISLLES